MKQRPDSTIIPIRYVVLFLCVTMAALLYLTRVNINVALVAMVKQTNKTEKNSTDGCFVSDKNSTKIDSNEESDTKKYGWNTTEQGIILGAFYYGYVLFQVMGGRLAEMWGAKWLCASGLLLSGIINLLTPVIADWNLIALIISRVILGAVQSVDFPAGYSLLTKWFPEQESGTALGIFTAGSNIGAIITMVLSGYLSASNFLGGWPSVFYTAGFLSCLWFVFWILLIKSEPKENHFLSQKEFEYIMKNKSGDTMSNKPKAPWISIITSKSVLALIVIKFTGAWNFVLVMTKVPAYLQSVLNYPIAQNGNIMALIYFSLFLSMSSGGIITDFIVAKKLMHKTLVRKIFQTFAIGGSSTALAFIPLAGCNKSVVIAIFMVAMLSYGQVSGGDIPIVTDMTSNFPGTVIAIANSMATIAGILGPLIVGLIIKADDQSRVLWSYVFYLSAVLNAFGIIVFLIWGEAEVQEWDYIEDNHKKSDNTFYKNDSHQNDIVSKM